MTDIDFEQLGKMVDRMDALACAAAIPMPDVLRIVALDGAIRDMRDELRAFLASKGFDPWS